MGGLYSSLISDWRRLREAGVLEGKEAGATAGRPGAEQAEIARLRRQLAEPEQKLATTETALEIIGKAHALLVADLRERGHRAATQEALMGAYTALTAAGVTTRAAADLTGVPRATAPAISIIRGRQLHRKDY